MKENIHISLDVTHTTLAVLFIGLLIASSFWILSPFLISLVWASIIVIATWPVLLKLQALLAGKRGFAVTVMTIALLLILIIPMALTISTIIRNAENITTRVKSLASLTVPAPPQWLERIPIEGENLASRWRKFASLTPEERSAKFTPYVRTALESFVARAGSIGMTILNFLLTTIIAAIMYANGEVVREGVLKFARRLAGPQGEGVAILAAKAIRSVALGIVLTALIQAALGGIGMFVTGVPAASLLTAVTFLLCLAQIGPALVLIPAVIWLYSQEGALWGTILLIFTILALTLDNVIRPVLIKKGANLPLLLIFAGVIGGLIAFGVVGLFIGPVLLAVTYTLLKAWVTGSVNGDEAGSNTV